MTVQELIDELMKVEDKTKRAVTDSIMTDDFPKQIDKVEERKHSVFIWAK